MGYNARADQLTKLDASSPTLDVDICRVLRIRGARQSARERPVFPILRRPGSPRPKASSGRSQADSGRVQSRQELLRRGPLRTARTQEEMDALLASGARNISLQRGTYVIPSDVEGVAYVGARGGGTIVRFSGEHPPRKVDAANCSLDWGHYRARLLVLNCSFMFQEEYQEMREGNKLLGEGSFIDDAVRHSKGLAVLTLVASMLGVLGRPLDEALDVLEQAAKQGYAPAQSRLGMYCTSHCNPFADEGETATRYWLAKAALPGEPEAMHDMGVYYWNGTGVRANRGEAVAQWEARLEDAAAMLTGRHVMKESMRGEGAV